MVVVDVVVVVVVVVASKDVTSVTVHRLKRNLVETLVAQSWSHCAWAGLSTMTWKVSSSCTFRVAAVSP